MRIYLIFIFYILYLHFYIFLFFTNICRHINVYLCVYMFIVHIYIHIQTQTVEDPGGIRGTGRPSFNLHPSLKSFLLSYFSCISFFNYHWQMAILIVYLTVRLNFAICIYSFMLIFCYFTGCFSHISLIIM